MKLKKIISKVLSAANPYVNEFYSQHGEDVLLQSFLSKKLSDKNYTGFYIDIGAHHPMRFSNTYLFYKNGWSGINIDATPGSMKEFNKIRKRDINLEIGISGSFDELEYYSFQEPALNSFDKNLSEKRINEGCKLKEIILVKTSPINDILDKYIPPNKHIDFMTIDVEGFDLLVLQTLDFKKYAPDFFVVEDADFVAKDIVEYSKSETYCFLKNKGYKSVARNIMSHIFQRDEQNEC
jgi:hypothetical protein